MSTSPSVASMESGDEEDEDVVVLAALQGENDGESGALQEVSDVAEVLDPDFQRVCHDLKTIKCCTKSCLMELNEKIVYQHRRALKLMDKRYRIPFLHGQIFTYLAMLPFDEQNGKSKRVTKLHFHGRKICLEAWEYINGLHHRTYDRMMGHVKKNGLKPIEHGNKGRGRQLPQDTSSKVVEFLKNKAETIGHEVAPPKKSASSRKSAQPVANNNEAEVGPPNNTTNNNNETVVPGEGEEARPSSDAMVEPGALTSKPKKKTKTKPPKPVLPTIYLPCTVSKSSLFKEYKVSQTEKGSEAVSWGSFLTIWNRVMPNLKIRKAKPPPKALAPHGPPPLAPLALPVPRQSPPNLLQQEPAHPSAIVLPPQPSESYPAQYQYQPQLPLYYLQ